MAAAKKSKGQTKGLGRGLDALLGDAPKKREADIKTAARERSPAELPIEFLTANAAQPRKVFNEDAMKELTASIKARGMIAPILVRPMGRDKYEIVAGERRWRAAQKAKLHHVPVIIRTLTDAESAEISLIENVQRVDLNPVEEAEAYQRLADAYGRTQEEIARAVGKSRSHVANIMRLLGLPPKTRNALNLGVISMGHARALLACEAPDIYLDAVIEENLSVRDTERLVQMDAPRARGKKPAGKGAAPARPSAPGSKDADTRSIERDLAIALGLEVEINHKPKGAGAMTIKYRNLDQLDDICRRLTGAGV